MEVHLLLLKLIFYLHGSMKTYMEVFFTSMEVILLPSKYMEVEASTNFHRRKLLQPRPVGAVIDVRKSLPTSITSTSFLRLHHFHRSCFAFIERLIVYFL